MRLAGEGNPRAPPGRAATQAIYERLVEHFGRDEVLYDVDTIPLGIDFDRYLSQQVTSCEVLVTVIGNQWLDMLQEREHDEDDFVRIEIRAVLERALDPRTWTSPTLDLPPSNDRLSVDQLLL